MNKNAIRATQMMILICGLSLAACGGMEDLEPATGEPASSQELSQKDPVIGVHNAQTGTYKIRANILRKQFTDGGPIRVFKVVELDDGPFLLRAGLNMLGARYTEVLPLKLVAGKIFLKPLVKLSVCFQPSCPGSDFCEPTSQNNACKCYPSGGSCTFGNLENLDLGDVVIL